jgi:hypothetical protein
LARMACGQTSALVALDADGGIHTGI